MHVSRHEMDDDGTFGEASTGARERNCEGRRRVTYVKQAGRREARQSMVEDTLWNEAWDGEVETFNRRDPSEHTHGPTHVLKDRPYPRSERRLKGA